MTVRFALPDVGEGLHEAEIVRWLVAVGDTVTRDQPLVEVLTDKAQVELPSPAAGIVRTVAADEGAMVEVGSLLVEIDDGVSGTDLSGEAPSVGPAAVTPSVADHGPPAGPSPLGASSAAGPGRPKASPSTRKSAARLGVDLTSLSGTGPGGRILAADVDSAARVGPIGAPSVAGSGRIDVESGQPPVRAMDDPAGAGRSAGAARAPPPRACWASIRPAPTPCRGIRRLTAAAMTRSWSTIPHITGMDEVDATALLDARDRLRRTLRADGREADAAALTPLVLLAKAVSCALRRFPLVNAGVSDDGGSVTVYEHVNLGVAVATPDGLIVPVVVDADRRDLVGLAIEMQRVAVAARERTIGAEELRGGTFTVTNYGSLGGRFASPLILPGQAGIMGFGAIRERPIVLDGAVQARRTLPVVFSADHRIIDGDLSVAFQEAVIGLVAEPLNLLLGA